MGRIRKITTCASIFHTPPRNNWPKPHDVSQNASNSIYEFSLKALPCRAAQIALPAARAGCWRLRLKNNQIPVENLSYFCKNEKDVPKGLVDPKSSCSVPNSRLCRENRILFGAKTVSAASGCETPFAQKWELT